jgi:hypothetical protein
MTTAWFECLRLFDVNSLLPSPIPSYEIGRILILRDHDLERIAEVVDILVTRTAGRN